MKRIIWAAIFAATLAQAAEARPRLPWQQKPDREAASYAGLTETGNGCFVQNNRPVVLEFADSFNSSKLREGTRYSLWEHEGGVYKSAKRGQVSLPPINAPKCELASPRPSPNQALELLIKEGLDLGPQNSRAFLDWFSVLPQINEALRLVREGLCRDQSATREVVPGSVGGCSPVTALASVMALEAAVGSHRETANKSEHDFLVSLAEAAGEQVAACMEESR